MKRITNLYNKIIDYNNLVEAEKSARLGKLNTYGVKVFDKNKESKLRKLHEMLANKTFTTSKYRHSIIYEPKERMLAKLPYYPDRIVQHAIIRILEPIWYSIFTADSYACIKNKGIGKINQNLRKILKIDKNVVYCLKIDIRKFYENIDHDILKQIIRKKIKDKDVLWLLDDIIDSHEGVPIGNYTSMFFANLYLSYLDHYIKEVLKVKYYFRYCDDMVLLADNKEFLWDCFHKIKSELAKLKLEINPNYQVFKIAEHHKAPGRGIDFVGFVFYKNHTLIRNSIKKNIIKACKNLNGERDIKKIRKKLCGWFGWLKYSDSVTLIRTILDSNYYDKKLLWRKTRTTGKSNKE